jgi:hypothetical protein
MKDSTVANQALGPTSHSIVGMSVMERRLGCPGSANAETGLPDRPSEASTRGTLLHEAAARALLEGLTGDDVWDQDEEGADIIDAYLDVVLTLQQNYRATLLVEHRFHLRSIHVELYGTADAVLIGTDPVTGKVVVIVVDLKTGRMAVPVRREDGKPNLQLSGYGIGGLEAAHGQDVSRLELHVVQPLNGGHKHTSLNTGEVVDVILEITDIVNEALKPDAPRYAGEWCRFCKAAATCPALRDRAFDRANLVFDAVMDDPIEAVPAPSEMTNNDIAKALNAAEMLDLWITAVRQHAAGLIRQGVGVQGWKLVQRQGRRKWRDDAAAVRFIEGVGLDPWQRKVLSPAQVEKEAKRAAKETGDKITLNLAPLVTLSDPGTALAPESDPRPAVGSGADKVMNEGEVIADDDPLA